LIFNTILSNNLAIEDAIIMLIFSIVVFFISLALHEYAHSLAAYKMGDLTPKMQGRLTLNPLKHLDVSGFLAFLFLGFGWAKPVQINPLNFKKYRTGMRIVSIAGVLMNVFIGLLAAIIYAVLLATVGASSEVMVYIYLLLEMFMVVNSALAIFNFLPIIPLDGYNFITSFMKTENKFIRFNLRYGNILLFGVLIANIVLSRFGFNILSILYNYVFTPIKYLGVLL